MAILRFQLRAYRRADELGGGWVGTVYDCVARQQVALSEVMGARGEAEDFAKSEARKLMAGKRYQLRDVKASYTVGGYQSHLYAFSK